MAETPGSSAHSFDFSKMTPENLIVLGAAVELANLVQLFGNNAIKTLDIREQQALHKVVNTLEQRRVEAFKSAATQANVSGAMTTKLIAPGTDIGQ